MKIDLHIHTIPNKYLDRSFSFSDVHFKEYIQQNSFDIVAITNHNLFNPVEFKSAKSSLGGTNCLLLPGIEVSLENGHMLVIFDDTEDNLKLLKNISDEISKDEHDDHYFMDLATFNHLCCGKGALLIPHYKKSPNLSKTVLENLNDNIFVGEVDSPKKFFNLIKEENELTPVYFSDIRIGESLETKDYQNKSRFTYIDIDEKSFTSLKKGLKNKSVFLNSKKIPNVFEILNGKAVASTGINVLIGKRSSGKTYTLDHISEKGSNSCLYIQQFEITNTCDDTTFKRKLLESDKNCVLEFVSGINSAFDLLDSLKPIETNNCLDAYLSSLEDCASQSVTDIYSKCELYNYKDIEDIDTQELIKIINSIEILLDASENYKEIILKKISCEILIQLRAYFVKEFKRLSLKNRLIKEVNQITKKISNELGKVSSAKQIISFELYKYFKLMYAKMRFNLLIRSIDNRLINETTVFDKFKKTTRLRRYHDKRTWKSALSISSSININYLSDMSPSDAYIKYMGDVSISNKKVGDERYSIFYYYETYVVDKKGTQISGGQKAEFSLLSKLSNYKNYEIILIDEMESSFDNPFLNTEVIAKLKSISSTSTIFISTHNNNLGVSLSPDFYIYHFVDEDNNFLHYCGKSNDQYLYCKENGNKELLSKILMDTMEASKTAYDKRKDKYEIA